MASIISLISDKNDQNGAITAGCFAKTVKNNVQQFSGDALEYAQSCVMRFFESAPLIQNYAFPCKYSPMRIIRYKEGMHYGKHCDNVINSGIRTDISFTVFLSDPKEYEGGYLRIYDNIHFQDVKLEAGSIILYPSDSLHEITPVTSGERIVLVGWLQSTIKDKYMRHILSDMAQLRDQLFEQGLLELHEKAMHSFNRLYRLHCDL